MEALLKLNDRLTWCGITPGLSTIDSVRKTLGEPDEIENLTNGKIYHFCKGNIQATVLVNSSQIRKLLITRDMLTQPKTLIEFEKLFGPVPEKSCDEAQGLIYERQGVRIAADLHGDPLQIRWIELF